MRLRIAFACALALTLALATVLPAVAQTPGVTATEIKLGNTNPYSGPASAYGTIGKAIGAYFKKVNEEGGINGRKVNYITLDDGYSPPKAVEMVRQLAGERPERTLSVRPKIMEMESMETPWKRGV